MRHINPSRFGQRGAALAIGLILLAVTSLITVTAINTGAMQERMSANQDNHTRAFMAAEAGGASLVTWIRTNGWPTATNLPALQNNVVAGDPSITFTLTLQSPSWANSPLGVLIEGRAHSSDGSAVLARTRLLVELRRPLPPAAPSVDAPAAISCFNGPCRITAGNGQGADVGFGTISGFDHPIPPLNCGGAGCRMQPQNAADRPMPAVPSVFLTHEPSRPTRSEEKDFNAFHGLNRAGSENIIGNHIFNVARRSADYPLDPDTRTSTAPTLNSVFGGPAPTTSQLESNRTTSDVIRDFNVEVGTLVLNGEHLRMDGKELFVGLIVIRNCGTLDVRGNPNIYGAVIVEAVRTNGTACPDDYTPFTGSGTPAVRFSLDALRRAANPPSAGTGGATGVQVLRWTEFLQ